MRETESFKSTKKQKDLTYDRKSYLMIIKSGGLLRSSVLNLVGNIGREIGDKFQPRL